MIFILNRMIYIHLTVNQIVNNSFVNEYLKIHIL
jgi:hypothetical protein